MIFHPNGICEHLTNRFIRDSITIGPNYPPTLSIYNRPQITSKNDAYLATLNALDTWQELPSWQLIEDNGYHFDILFLVKSMTNQLNSIKMGNPFPIFPTNPFTHEQFSHGFIDKFKSRLYANAVKLSQVLKVFLDSFLVERTTLEWIEHFKINDLRYMRLDNESDYITGYWVNKFIPKSLYETLIDLQEMDFEEEQVMIISMSDFEVDEDYYFRYF
jgi:hypothetical protein